MLAGISLVPVPGGGFFAFTSDKLLIKNKLKIIVQSLTTLPPFRYNFQLLVNTIYLQYR